MKADTVFNDTLFIKALTTGALASGSVVWMNLELWLRIAGSCIALACGISALIAWHYRIQRDKLEIQKLKDKQ